MNSLEDHTIEPKGEAACLVKIVMSAEFDPDLSDEDVASEITMMSMAVNRDLQKLNVLAKEGARRLRQWKEMSSTLDSISVNSTSTGAISSRSSRAG